MTYRGRFAGWIVMCLTLAGAAGCMSRGSTVPSPEDGIRRAEPIIAALARYQAAHGVYPGMLRELVPLHLPADMLVGWEGRSSPYTLLYEPLQNRSSYEFRFLFRARGGGVRCAHRPGIKRWRCSDLR